MLTTFNPTGMWEIAETIRLCIHETLEAKASTGAPDRSCVVWGATAWDNCCGQLTVAIGPQFPANQSGATGAGAQQQSRCGFPLLGVTFTATLLRCAPSVDSNGQPPTCEALSGAALIAAEDAHWVRNAAICCLRGLSDDEQLYDWRIATQNPAGPQGSCQGSELAMNLFFVNSCNCAEGSGS